MKKRLYILSPHFDDAIFSVGGIIDLWSSSFDTVTIINIFSASSPPPEKLSPQAKLFHQRFKSNDPVEIRRCQDSDAFNCFEVKVIEFAELDAIYRSYPISNEPLYQNPIDIFGSIHELDRQLIIDISRKLESLIKYSENNLFLAPLSIGGHVDHEITRLSAEVSIQDQLLYYEDCPYAFQKSLRHTYPEMIKNMNPYNVYLNSNHVNKKAQAISHYDSSISVNSFIDYMKSHKKGRFIERLWSSQEFIGKIPN